MRAIDYRRKTKAQLIEMCRAMRCELQTLRTFRARQQEAKKFRRFFERELSGLLRSNS